MPAGPDRIEVAACTQAPYMDRDETARVLGIAPEHVRIRPTACGGGFGGKLDVSVQPLLAVAAWKCTGARCASSTRAPSRWPPRPSGIRRTICAQRLGRRARPAHRLREQADFNTGAYASWGPTVANRVPVHASGPYRVPNV